MEHNAPYKKVQSHFLVGFVYDRSKVSLAFDCVVCNCLCKLDTMPFFSVLEDLANDFGNRKFGDSRLRDLEIATCEVRCVYKLNLDDFKVRQNIYSEVRAILQKLNFMDGLPSFFDVENKTSYHFVNFRLTDFLSTYFNKKYK